MAERGKKRRRSREKADYWAKAIQEQAKSGQSVRAYCQKRKICENRFYAWRRELNYRRILEQKSNPAGSKDKFTPLSVRLTPPTPSVFPIEIEIPGRYRVRIATDEIGHLGSILSALDSARC